MDPMKSRRWIAAAALAAAVVFLVMITGEHGPAVPNAAPAPVSSSGAVLASDGGPTEENTGNGGGGGEDADREEVLDALQGLIEALGVSADELAGCGEGAGSGRGESSGKGSSGCGALEPAAGGRSGEATIRIAGFSFGQPTTVAPGARVEVVNTDAAAHNVTASDGSFETPDLNQDEKATFTAPTKPGRYQFTCTIHPEMTGTLIVEGTAGERDRSRSSESGTGSGRAGGGQDGSEGSRQPETTAPDKHGTSGSTDGY
ncbi:hypothetical protein GCM10009559_65950 [Pseudonocardia zijingensis]|uniref:EfeO-type cupredoxin-like domain-containing protein n=2 Tax=Pseudonocardia zijingensis TaxID=153376 RepID=A0ABP3YN89_9PSEU